MVDTVTNKIYEKKEKKRIKKCGYKIISYNDNLTRGLKIILLLLTVAIVITSFILLMVYLEQKISSESISEYIMFGLFKKNEVYANIIRTMVSGGISLLTLFIINFLSKKEMGLNTAELEETEASDAKRLQVKCKYKIVEEYPKTKVIRVKKRF